MTTTPQRDIERDLFEAWWESHGQFCRAGGGDYEKTFAYRAWQARAAQATAEPEEFTDAMYFAWDGFDNTMSCEERAAIYRAVRAAAPDRAPSTEPVLARQVATWRKEVARLQDLIGTAAGAPSTDSAADARDAARYRFMMSFQDGGEQPEEILMMWRKVIAEHRLTPTRADYESAIDAAIAASMPQKEEAPPYERRRFER